MTKRKAPAPPPELCTIPGRNMIVSLYGELAPSKTVLLQNVIDIARVGFPYAEFSFTVKRDGMVIGAQGAGVRALNAELAYPGCNTAEDVAAVYDVFHAAGLTRGDTPAGRALDLLHRTQPYARQWRISLPFMNAFAQALYGGFQYGGTEKPSVTRGVYYADIVSSYPYLAAAALPTIASFEFQRNWQRGALFVHITHARQASPALLFYRQGDGLTTHPETVTGWYVAEEVAYLADMGLLTELAVDKSITCRHAEPYLTPVIDHLFSWKARETGVRQLAVKVALNGLIGKFGARLSPWRMPRSGEDIKPFNKLIIGANTIIKDPALLRIYPRTSNIAWPAIVNARARLRLWQKMHEIQRAGGTVLWAHTDAVFAVVPDDYAPPSGCGIGDWRTLERTYTHTRREHAERSKLA